MSENIRAWPVARLWDGEPQTRIATSVQHIMVRAQVDTVGELLEEAQEDFPVLSSFRGFGREAHAAHAEVFRVLAARGLIDAPPPAERPEPGEAAVRALVADMQAGPATGASEGSLFAMARHLLRLGYVRKRSER
jgi:hypothetical protein